MEGAAATRRLSDAFRQLAWTIHPVTVEDFFAQYWEKKPLVVNRKTAGYNAGLLSIDEIDRVLTTLNPYHPDVAVANANREVKSGDYTFDSGMIDVARLYQRFAEGGTIVLSSLHMFVHELAQYCRAMEQEFSTRYQTNIYLTPAGSQQGFKKHYDNHDVFVLQVSGTKHWRIYGTPVELPLRGQNYDSTVHEAGDTTMEFTLHPGDMVYIPRGIMHAAVSDEDVSLHITVGVLTRTWTDLLLEALSAQAIRDVAFRATLPPGFARDGFDRAAARKMFQELTQRFMESSDFDRALDHFADDLASTRHPLLRGQLQQILDLGGLTIESIVGARPSLVYRVIEKGEQVIVTCYGSDISLPIHASEPLRFALETQRFAVKDLPGELDDEGKLVLIRRLVREGMVMKL